jgi:hypothetical protein
MNANGLGESLTSRPVPATLLAGEGPMEESNRERTLDDELTDGYAHALTLEAERRATLRNIAAAATSRGRNSDEVKQLAFRLGVLDGQIAELRADLDKQRRTVDPRGRLY